MRSGVSDRDEIFIWHKHEGCKYFAWPKSNTDFWHSKIEGNVQRDVLKEKQLAEAGWRIIVVWECELKGGAFLQRMDALVQEIIRLETHCEE